MMGVEPLQAALIQIRIQAGEITGLGMHILEGAAPLQQARHAV